VLNQQPHSKQRILVAKTYNIGWIEGDVIRKKNCLKFFRTTNNNAMATKGQANFFLK
jgi:hypothetical protein